MGNDIQNFSFNGNQVRTVLINDDPYFVGKDVAEILGYKNARDAIQKHISDNHKMHVKILCNKQYRQVIVINNEGVRQLVSSSRMPNAIQLAHALDINIYLALNCTKEQQFINDIIHAFRDEKMVRQYPCGSYKIDLYFPEYQIAIECDELGHKDRDPEYEVNRQSYIENELGCQFIRFNPDEEEFNIFDVINRIYKEIRN